MWVEPVQVPPHERPLTKEDLIGDAALYEQMERHHAEFVWNDLDTSHITKFALQKALEKKQG
jgi:hypothetical protein